MGAFIAPSPFGFRISNGAKRHRPSIHLFNKLANFEFNHLLSMPRIPIIMPQLGESIAEATIVNISVKPGETVEADEDVLEVETNKAVMTVTSPCRGKVENWVVEA